MPRQIYLTWYPPPIAFDVFSRNGAILPATEAQMPLSNIEYAYGFGVYESLRVVRGKVFFLGQHVERLMHSARVLDLAHAFAPEDIAAWAMELTKQLDTEACNLKMLLIGAREAKDATLFIIPLAPLFPDKRLYTKGASAVTFLHERFLPHAKALNMLPSYMAYRTAKAKGCYDALFLSHRGEITEGTRTNFFVLRGMTIVSPPMEEILEGVTLKNVLTVAKENGYEISYEPIPLEKLSSYDGAFLTSTSSKIMPLTLIDDTALQIPDALKKLMKNFDEFLATLD